MKKYIVLLAFVAFFALFRLFGVEPTAELQKADIFKDAAHLFVAGLIASWWGARGRLKHYPPTIEGLTTDRDVYCVTGWGLVGLEITAFLIGKYAH